MTRILFDDVDAWAEKQPAGIAIRWTDDDRQLISLSCRELSQWSNRIGRPLVDLGVERGDRVAICIPKGLAAIAAMLGGQEREAL